METSLLKRYLTISECPYAAAHDKGVPSTLLLYDETFNEVTNGLKN